MRSNVFIGLLTLVIFICFCINSLTAGDSDPKTAAQSSRDLLKQRAGSEESLRKNLMNPLLGSDLLKTLDQSLSGQVQLVCPSSKEFLTVLIKPKGTGDFDADVYWDSDLDGKMDKAAAFYNVSGICTNGFITCDPGTWMNCRPQLFKYNEETKQLTTELVGLTDLSGCFCINSSCGSNLVWTNIGYVLKIFGGAVAGAFQQANPRYAVSDARLDGAAIYFYGQKTKDCTIAEGGSGALSPEVYYKSPMSIGNAVESLVISQQSQPDSYYNLIVAANQQTQFVLNSCAITRNANELRLGLYDIISPVSGNGGQVRSCGEKCIQVVLGWEGNNYWCGCCDIHELCYDLLIKKPDKIKSARIVYAAWDDWIQFWLNDTLAWNGPYGNWTSPTGGPPGACELSTSWRWGLNVDVTPYFNAVAPNSILRTKTRVAVCGCGEGYGLVNVEVQDYCEKQESISDTCSTFEQDPTCVLKDEIIDGVYTVKNGIRTGLRPLPQCRVFCGQQYCPDYWRIERIYTCTSQGVDLSKAKQRLATIVPSTQYNESQGQITFNDIRYENNQWKSYPNQIFWVGTETKPDACEQACRVRVATKDTQVGIAGNVNARQAGQAGQYVYYYRTCEKGVCPVQAGEEMDIPCRCMNDFGAASTLLQTLRLAGQDMICTSGNVKTLPGY